MWSCHVPLVDVSCCLLSIFVCVNLLLVSFMFVSFSQVMSSVCFCMCKKLHLGSLNLPPVDFYDSYKTYISFFHVTQKIFFMRMSSWISLLCLLAVNESWSCHIHIYCILFLLFGKMWPGLNFPKLTFSVLQKKKGQMGVTWGWIYDDMSFIFITVICVSIIPESYFYCTLGFVNKTRHVSHVIGVKNRR